jgi:hypothetical protein
MGQERRQHDDDDDEIKVVEALQSQENTYK